MELLLLLALPFLFGSGAVAGDGAEEAADTRQEAEDPATSRLAAAGFAEPAATAQATEGNDSITLTNASEYLDALGGDDYVFGHNASDTLIGGDLLDGVSHAADGDGPDQLFGGKGADTLHGDQGDWLAGGERDDVFVIRPGGPPVIITDFLTEAQNPDPASDGDSLLVEVPADLNSRDMTADLWTRDAANGTDSEVLLGDQVVAIVRGGAGQAIWPELAFADSDRDWGTAGDDRLTGSHLADFHYGGDGADTILSRGGDDMVHDGFDNDVVSLGQGNDVFLGADRDYGMADNDIIRGGRGDDALASALGADTLHGDAGNDRLDATDLAGLTGPQADRLSGGLGNDTLTGDAGDRLAGGSGADDFHVLPGGMVTVPDFNPAEDELVLHVARDLPISFQASGSHTLILVGGEPMVTLNNILPPALAGAMVRAA